ncbi:MAG: lipopolysaccharide biosynthesis protein [Muribaculaceae bacterium]
MANLNSLLKDTVIYGLSSIVGRFLNYLLVPLYTHKLAAASGGYGTITNIYAYVALTLVILVFGMETTFFRFANKKECDSEQVFGTALTFVTCLAAIFLAVVLGGLTPISGALGYADHPEFIAFMAITVALDAFQAVPFAYLRYQHKPIKFASLKLAFIAINIILNVIAFTCFTPYEGNAFLINMICTSLITFAFAREVLSAKWNLNMRLLKQMLAYSWPMLVLGIAGTLNQTADKIIFPFIYHAANAKEQLGIYGGVVKIAMIMAMITQAFRYAYEPIVFGKGTGKDNNEYYASAMRYFVVFTLLAFLCVVAYLDILKYLVGADYREGLKVVPIVMAAEIMMGVYFNLSFWYKLTDRTIWGAVLSTIGCVVLIAVNIAFVPTYSYVACAWAGCAGYGTAMVLSYFVGQHYYPIAYPLKAIGGYTLLAAALFAAMTLVPMPSTWLNIAYRTALLLVFVAVIYRVEHLDRVMAKLPMVGRFFRKA